MALLTRRITVPVFIKVEKNILNKTQKIFEENNFKFSHPLFLSSKRFAKFAKKIFLNTPFEKLEICDNSQECVSAAISEIRNKNIDAVFACGGGRVLDVGKYAASRTGISFISIPTGPSNDGIASPVAVIKNENGLSESLAAEMPTGILVDLEVIKTAPERNIRAGIGDLLSNFSAIEDWRLAGKEVGEKIDDFALSLSYTAVDFIYTMCLSREKINIKEEEFLKSIVYGLILSGIAMAIAGTSRPSSGAEHMISHAIDKLYPNTAMHGEQVAVGTVIAERMRKGDYKRYIKIFKKLNVPYHWKQLGLTRKQMVNVMLYAPKTRPGRYTIFNKIKLNKNTVAKFLDY